LNSNIFLTGFSGSGKTSVGHHVAARMQREFVDLDVEISEFSNMSIEEIFSEEGESKFRQIETEILTKISSTGNQVISTGGGIVENDQNHKIMNNRGKVICLETTPETIHSRLEEQYSNDTNAVHRPMLSGGYTLESICDLKRKRQHLYSRAHWTVHTDLLTIDQVSDEVVRAYKLLDNGLRFADDSLFASVVQTSSGDCPIWVGWDIISTLGDRLKSISSSKQAFIICDDGTKGFAELAERSIQDSGISVEVISIPPGETSKTLQVASDLYEWLGSFHAERNNPVIAVGGGVVGDISGFVAATYLRGMPFVQVPTSMLAMMDASIGGKTAVDMPHGKNLVGSFHQPEFVLVDVKTLIHLPKRHLSAGWAEAIKHGFILDEQLVSDFERNATALMSLERDITTEIVKRSIAIKSEIVSMDEHETLGKRILLNYGHTIGHAIEFAGGFNRYLHGEAVSIGMVGAANISMRKGLLTKDEVARQISLQEMMGLPVKFSELGIDEIERAMLSDKKSKDQQINWVLLDGLGNAVVDKEVDSSVVSEIINDLRS